MMVNKAYLKTVVLSLLVIAACGMVVEWSVRPAGKDMLPRKLPQMPASAKALPIEETGRALSIFDRRDDAAVLLAASASAFEPREWNHPVPVPQLKAVVPAVPPPANVAEAAPPPVIVPSLPFKYMGQMEDGGLLIIYLSRGEQTIVAHVGEILDKEYRVASVNRNNVEFEILSSGGKLSLPIPTAQ